MSDHRHSHGEFTHSHDDGEAPHDHLRPDEILPDDYAAIHGPTVGDRVRLGDTGLLVEIEYDAQHRGDEFIAGFAKTARDGLMLKAAESARSRSASARDASAPSAERAIPT